MLLVVGCLVSHVVFVGADLSAQRAGGCPSLGCRPAPSALILNFPRTLSGLRGFGAWLLCRLRLFVAPERRDQSVVNLVTESDDRRQLVVVGDQTLDLEGQFFVIDL